MHGKFFEAVKLERKAYQSHENKVFSQEKGYFAYCLIQSLGSLWNIPCPIISKLDSIEC